MDRQQVIQGVANVTEQYPEYVVYTLACLIIYVIVTGRLEGVIKSITGPLDPKPVIPKSPGAKNPKPKDDGYGNA